MTDRDPIVSALDPQNARLEAAREVLGQLPAEQREVLVLLGFYRLSRAEISALLGQPIARIDSVFRAAVRSLRDILGPQQRMSFA